MNTSQFPAPSIGRSTGSRIQPTQDVSHPLLSPNSESAPKYVPYTPRQRGISTATTTGTIVHPPSSPQSQQSNATSKLQLMHLKAAAQNIGLDSSTIGWAILERLGSPQDGVQVWNEIWHMVSSGKAHLFLPLETVSSNDKITAEFVKDHVYLSDPSSSQLVTLSGLRGHIEGQAITFRSTISTSSKTYHELLPLVSRETAFGLLPPLPQSSFSYPRILIQSDSTALPIPPRGVPATKPSLPPRPNARGSGQTNSRIPNPFASLFGQASKAGPSSGSTSIPPSPPASVRSFDSTQDSPVDIIAVTTDRKILRKEIAKQMNKTLKNELKEMLSSATVPPPAWVMDRVLEFCIDWFPFVRPVVALSNVLEKRDKEYDPNPYEESPDEVADRLQDFYAALEHDIRHTSSSSLTPPRRQTSDRDLTHKGSEKDVNNEKQQEQVLEEFETRIREIMEVVERAICTLFYDRLFRQQTADDASHDETLASRISALNKLDLGLHHLDVLVGDGGPDIDVVVHACGDMLSQLDPCKCPGDKASVLVAAHKVLVDGLSRLPPIRLKAEEELRTVKPKLEPTKAEGLKSSPALGHINMMRSTSTSSTVSQEINNLAPLANGKTPILTSSPYVPSPLPILSPLASEFETEKREREENEGKQPLSEDVTKDSSPSEKKLPPVLQLEPAHTPTPVSGDTLFPLLIYSVVKSNPPHLLSNLLFTQRFRNQSIGGRGEESYCLINLLAVAEFLENVDLEGLGLGGHDVNPTDLSPIVLARTPATTTIPSVVASPLSISSTLAIRDRMGQGVDAIADSANKVISGVVDSSFGILRSFLPAPGSEGHRSRRNSLGISRPSTPGAAVDTWKLGASPKPGLSEKTGVAGFSIANIAASLPISVRGRTKSGEEAGQQLISVSRASSVKSRGSVGSRGSTKGLRIAGESSDEESDEEAKEEGEEESNEGHASTTGDRIGEDAKTEGSTKDFASFESMLAAEKAKAKAGKRRQESHPASSARGTPSVITTAIEDTKEARAARKSLSDRLARVSSSGLSARAKADASSPLRQNSLTLHPPAAVGMSRERSGDTVSTSFTLSSRSPSPTSMLSPHSRRGATPQLRIAPPMQRFLDTTPDDLRLSEVGELLKDYKRLVEAIRSAGGFEGQ